MLQPRYHAGEIGATRCNSGPRTQRFPLPWLRHHICSRPSAWPPASSSCNFASPDALSALSEFCLPGAPEVFAAAALPPLPPRPLSPAPESFDATEEEYSFGGGGPDWYTNSPVVWALALAISSAF